MIVQVSSSPHLPLQSMLFLSPPVFPFYSKQSSAKTQVDSLKLYIHSIFPFSNHHSFSSVFQTHRKADRYFKVIQVLSFHRLFFLVSSLLPHFLVAADIFTLSVSPWFFFLLLFPLADWLIKNSTPTSHSDFSLQNIHWIKLSPRSVLFSVPRYLPSNSAGRGGRGYTI